MTRTTFPTLDSFPGYFVVRAYREKSRKTCPTRETWSREVVTLNAERRLGP